EVLALELEDLSEVFACGERQQHAGPGRQPRGQGKDGSRRVDALASREADDGLREHLPSLGGMLHARQGRHRGVGQTHLEEALGHVRHRYLMGGDVDADAIEEVDPAQALRELGPVHDGLPSSPGSAGSAPSQGARSNQRSILGVSVSSGESWTIAPTDACPRSYLVSARPTRRTLVGASSVRWSAKPGSAICASAFTWLANALRSVSCNSFKAAIPSASLPRSNAINMNGAVLMWILSVR